jgi:hypothetical protein
VAQEAAARNRGKPLNFASPREFRRSLAAVTLLLTVAVAAESSMGRLPWGVGGQPGLWSGNIWSEHNSQFVADPYTFTHITHGVAFYALFAMVARSAPLHLRLIGTVALETAWEVLENSDLIIKRYRTETISLNYYGDSIVNSIADVFACISGFYIASRLPRRVTAAAVVIMEVVLAVWIHDNLTLNILMLLAPSQAIRSWQLGR